MFPSLNCLQHSATTQDQLRGDVARLMRQIEDLRGASAAADAGDTARAQPDPAAGDVAQQRAVREAVEAIAQRLRDDGAAADSADVVRTQADRIVNQSQTVRCFFLPHASPCGMSKQPALSGGCARCKWPR